MDIFKRLSKRSWKVLWSSVLYFALALYFYHRSCILAHQNAVTVLSVWTLSHWLWPSSTLPRNSLILLASARNVVTTGMKTRLVWTCEWPPNTGHWPSPPSSTDVKCESWSVQWMLIDCFVLQTSNSLLWAHHSRMTNLASAARS